MNQFLQLGSNGQTTARLSSVWHDTIQLEQQVLSGPWQKPAKTAFIMRVQYIGGYHEYIKGYLEYIGGIS